MRPTQTPTEPRPSLALRILNVIEVVGNKLPTPTTLFVIFRLVVLPASWMAEGLDRRTR
jgi:p-aminobenzoyl-glutamate transporter AbgT